jgi:Winged helix DNA-binding domain
MPMKPLDLSRRRMANSRLTGESFETPEEVVGWHLAMQAQEYGPAAWSVGQRSTGLVHADVEEAVVTGSIVRTHVLRPTWHFVARDDIRWLLAISGPRVQQGNAGRYRDLGLDERTRTRAEAAIVSALQGGVRLTRNEIGGVLDDAGIDREGQRLPYILMHCELEAVIGSGGLSGKQQTYALLDERVPKGRRVDRDDALVELARRYLGSHGPATVKDMNWWSGFTMADIRKALEMLGDEVRSETIDGVVFWSITGDEAPPPPARGAHLLQTYDELVVGYTESRFHAQPGAEKARAAWGDRTYPSGLFLLNGRVGGHWRRTFERDAIAVEVNFYEEPKRGHRSAVEAAVADLGRFFGLEVALETKLLRGGAPG